MAPYCHLKGVIIMKHFALKLFAGLALSLAVAAPSFAQSTSQSLEQEFGDHVTFRVVGVAYNDVLNMRAGPGPRRPIVGVLYPNEGGIFIGRCSQYVNWCRVRKGNKIGWVNRRFLRNEF